MPAQQNEPEVDQNASDRAMEGEEPTAPLQATLSSTEPAATARSWFERRRITALVRLHWDFVGRLVRHLGVVDADAEDAAQQVFLTLDQKLGRVERGRERAFLAACAVNVAARFRRTRGRLREVSDESVWELTAAEDDPERALEQKRRLARLDRMLAAMSDEQRAVFVLHEIEELTMLEIAAALSLPQGTVASRLRRAREIFEEELAR